jgi:hypothetical protein
VRVDIKIPVDVSSWHKLALIISFYLLDFAFNSRIWKGLKSKGVMGPPLATSLPSAGGYPLIEEVVHCHPYLPIYIAGSTLQPGKE